MRAAAAYLELLQTPYGIARVHADSILASLRNEIVRQTGFDDETVQNSFELVSELLQRADT
jgi:hypothetical protein